MERARHHAERRPAIELTLKEVYLKGKTTNSWTEYLWVDASTYLPLHDVTTFGPVWPPRGRGLPVPASHARRTFALLTPARPAGVQAASTPGLRSSRRRGFLRRPWLTIVRRRPPLRPAPSPSASRRRGRRWIVDHQPPLRSAGDALTGCTLAG